MTAYDHSSGYTYGTDAVPTSPLTLEDLRQIEAAAHVQPRDAELLSRAEPVLAPHAMEMVDTWRGILAQKTYLAAHSAHPDGSRTPSTRRPQSHDLPSGSSTCARASGIRRGWTTST